MHGVNPRGQDHEPAVSPRTAAYTLLILLVVHVLAHIDRNILSMLIEPIKAEFDLSDTSLGFLTGLSFALFYVTLGIPAAWIADRRNRRNFVAWSCALWSVMTALCGLAQNFWQLAAARMGVGVGEAGAGPASVSILSQVFPRERRSLAMSIYGLGANIGIFVGLIVGGLIVSMGSWRTAFFVVGLPGLLLAAIVRLTLKESSRPAAADPELIAPPLPESVRIILASAAMRHIMAGASLTGFIAYGIITWVPTFLIRSHSMTHAGAGAAVGVIIGVLGAIGALSGGRVVDRLALRDVRWSGWVVALAKLISVPFVLAYLLLPQLDFALISFAAAALMTSIYLGPTYATVQALAPVHLRSLATAILLLMLNLVGLGLGPQVVGMLSDFFQPRFGIDSLRYALAIVSLVQIWAAWHYWRAGKLLALELDQTTGERCQLVASS